MPGGFSDIIYVLEHMEFKLEEYLGFRNMQEKLENALSSNRFKLF
jgi:hypothetical protein